MVNRGHHYSNCWVYRRWSGRIERRQRLGRNVCSGFWVRCLTDETRRTDLRNQRSAQSCSADWGRRTVGQCHRSCVVVGHRATSRRRRRTVGPHHRSCVVVGQFRVVYWWYPFSVPQALFGLDDADSELLINISASRVERFGKKIIIQTQGIG